MNEYISKDDVLLHSEIIRVYSKDYGNIDVVPVEYLADIPAADVQPVKHGRWINHRINDEKSLLHGAIKDTTCSECGKSTPYKTDYCMHCGARMDGDTE